MGAPVYLIWKKNYTIPETEGHYLNGPDGSPLKFDSFELAEQHLRNLGLVKEQEVNFWYSPGDHYDVVGKGEYARPWYRIYQSEDSELLVGLYSIGGSSN
jgi:hypothetical protein